MAFITPKTWAVGEVLSAVDMNVYVRDNTNALNDSLQQGYRYAGRRIYSTPGSSTFEKADPFGDGSLSDATVRAIRVICVGGGGAGGGGATTGSSQASVAAGGSSGSYAESLFTDLAALASSVTVTVGAGGAGATGAAGGDGGDSSFASGSYLVRGRAGRGGGRTTATTGLLVLQGTLRTLGTSTGQIIIEGEAGMGAIFDTSVIGPTSDLFGGDGGSGVLGSGGRGLSSTQGGSFSQPSGYGAGGVGVSIITGSTTAVAGKNGGSGVVIVDVYI